jgi:heat shock protein 4
VKNLVTEICKGKELYEGIKSLDVARHGAAMTGAIALGVDNPFGNLELFDFPFTSLAFRIRANG